MRFEKTVVNNDGSKFKITVNFIDPDRRVSENYQVDVMKCDKGKRTFYQPYDTDSYLFRALSMEERRNKITANVINLIGKEIYNQSLCDCWKQLEPKYI